MAAQGSHRLASPAATKEILDIIAVHAIATRHPPHHRKTRKMQCVACGKPTLMVCSACKITAYCSTECQATCWKTHYASCVHKPKMLLVNRKSILPSALPRFEFGLPSAACGSEGLVYETSHVFNDAKAIGSLHFDAFDRPTDQNARSDIIGGRNRKIPLYDRGYDVKHYPILANADRMGGADISRRMTGYGDVSVKIYTIQNASAALPLELAMELYPRNLTHPNVASLYTAGLVSAPPYSSGVSGATQLHLVTDAGGTLTDLIKYEGARNAPFAIPPSELPYMAYQLAYAAIHCQDNLICNVSLDPRHVMVQNIEGVMSRAADDIPVRRLILADFSGSRQFCDGIAIVDAEFSPVSYSAPELLFGSWNATFNSDAWQLACVLYEMATGDVLFPIKMPGDHRKVKAQIAELMTSNDLQFEAVFFPKFKEKTKKYKSLGIQTVPAAMFRSEIRGRLTQFPGLADVIDEMLVASPPFRTKLQDILSRPFFSTRDKGIDLILAFMPKIKFEPRLKFKPELRFIPELKSYFDIVGDYLPAPGPLAVPFDKKDGDVIKEIFATWSRAVYGRPAIVFRALAVFWTFAKKRNASTAGEESPSASAMGYACLLIATNINHDLTARREIFDDISDTAKDVTACMFHVLKVLDFDLAIPSPFEILLKYYYGPNENIVGDDGEMQYAKAAIDLALAYALPETALLVSPKDLVLGALIAHSGSRPVIDENRADVRYAPNIRAAERVIKTAHANISRIAWLKEIAEDVMDGLNVPATTVDQLVSTFLTS